MFRRRRETKKLRQVARMLQALDAAAARSGTSARRSRISLSRA